MSPEAFEMLGLKPISSWANTLHLPKTPINQGSFSWLSEGWACICSKALSHRVATKREGTLRSSGWATFLKRITLSAVISSSKKMQEILWPRVFSEEMRFPFKSENYFLTSESGDDPVLQVPLFLRYKASQCHFQHCQRLFHSLTAFFKESSIC